jgi:serine protease
MDYRWSRCRGGTCRHLFTAQPYLPTRAMGTGSFAMQSTRSNDTNECDISHPVMSGCQS